MVRRCRCTTVTLTSHWCYIAVTLPQGASVVEVMPVHRYGCPCEMYKKLYTYQGPSVFHYQMVSTNASNAVSTEVRARIDDVESKSRMFMGARARHAVGRRGEEGARGSKRARMAEDGACPTPSAFAAHRRARREHTTPTCCCRGPRSSLRSRTSCKLEGAGRTTASALSRSDKRSWAIV